MTTLFATLGTLTVFLIASVVVIITAPELPDHE